MNMKKSLIALAVASAFVAPVAMAETTIYGNMHVSIDRADTGTNTNAAKTNQLNSNESALGFKGAEDLSGGMSAIWQIETEIAADGSASEDSNGDTFAGTSIGTRNTFVGLKSDSMGTVLVGNYDTPYKKSTRALDMFATTAADNRTDTGTGAQGMSMGRDARVGNSFNYLSPDMGGLSVAAATVFGAEDAGNGDTKGSARSVAAMYTMDNIYATVAIDSAKAGTDNSGDLSANGKLFKAANGGAAGAVGDKASALKLGGSYTMDPIVLNLVYEKLTYKPAAGGDAKNTNIYFAAKYSLSSTDAVKLAYSTLGDTKPGNTKNGAKQTSIGYDHSMSKNTMVYALYTKVALNATNGAEPTDISFGLKHSF